MPLRNFNKVDWGIVSTLKDLGGGESVLHPLCGFSEIVSSNERAKICFFMWLLMLL